ncbi:MAG: 1,4-dihydroxy-6-naphthoate synthase [Fibrobacter sp.]|nr:1,4-dihydroxy-6-naphthoate synthase [Fibrobacter sp.]
MRLSLGISTCPNDTFIYENLIKGLKESPFEWDVHYADVQTLNEMVMASKLDVAKVSAQIFPAVRENYRVLGCGGAIGYGCGPLLLSSTGEYFNSEDFTTLPGKNTTAALLFKFWYEKKIGGAPRLRYAFFDEVYRGLLAGSISQGVTIHEHRFTWKRDGLHLLQDLGAFWEQETGTPIPLGIAVARKGLSREVIEGVESEIRRSLKMAWARCEMVTPFIQEKAQIEEKNVIESHIKMFVNDFSESIGEKGEAALDRLWLLSDC